MEAQVKAFLLSRPAYDTTSFLLADVFWFAGEDLLNRDEWTSVYSFDELHGTVIGCCYSDQKLFVFVRALLD